MEECLITAGYAQHYKRNIFKYFSIIRLKKKWERLLNATKEGQDFLKEIKPLCARIVEVIEEENDKNHYYTLWHFFIEKFMREEKEGCKTSLTKKYNQIVNIFKRDLKI